MSDSDDLNATTFIYRKEIYEAKNAYNNCDGCAFDDLEQFKGCQNSKRPYCSAFLRADKRYIIWVKKK